FSSRRRHTRSYGDWSSDVCSSDLHRSALRAILIPPCPFRINIAGKIAVVARIRINDATNRAVLGRDLGLDAAPRAAIARDNDFRSEERRVGKECRARWWGEHSKKK